MIIISFVKASGDDVVYHNTVLSYVQAALAAVSATPSQPQLARFYIHSMKMIGKRLVSLTPQVQSMRSLEASELTYLPPENVRKLWVQGEKIILCQRPTFAADVFSFGYYVAK